MFLHVFVWLQGVYGPYLDLGQYPQDHTPPRNHTHPPPDHESRQYASYYNAFLFTMLSVAFHPLNLQELPDQIYLRCVICLVCRGCNYLIAWAEGGSEDKKQDITGRAILLTATRTFIFSLINCYSSIALWSHASKTNTDWFRMKLCALRLDIFFSPVLHYSAFDLCSLKKKVKKTVPCLGLLPTHRLNSNWNKECYAWYMLKIAFPISIYRDYLWSGMLTFCVFLLISMKSSACDRMS